LNEQGRILFIDVQDQKSNWALLLVIGVFS
jgi:hypothetical protein